MLIYINQTVAQNDLKTRTILRKFHCVGFRIDYCHDTTLLSISTDAINQSG